MYSVEDLVRTTQMNCRKLGWKGSDGGIDAWIDEGIVYVAVPYNQKKLTKKQAMAAGRKMFGSVACTELLEDRDESVIIIALNKTKG